MIDNEDNYYICGKYWCNTATSAKNDKIYADQVFLLIVVTMYIR